MHLPVFRTSTGAGGHDAPANLFILLCRALTCAALVCKCNNAHGMLCVPRQEWKRLCSQPGESCEQHNERLKAAGLSFPTCEIQPREAVWEALQRMLGMSPAEAWKIASASGHGSIAGGTARSLEPGEPDKAIPCTMAVPVTKLPAKQRDFCCTGVAGGVYYTKNAGVELDYAP